MQVLDLSGRGETSKRPHPGSVMISTACVAEGLVCCGGFNGELVVANLGQPGHVARWSPAVEGWEVEGILLTGATLKMVTVTGTCYLFTKIPIVQVCQTHDLALPTESQQPFITICVNTSRNPTCSAGELLYVREGYLCLACTCGHMHLAWEVLGSI